MKSTNNGQESNGLLQKWSELNIFGILKSL